MDAAVWGRQQCNLRSNPIEYSKLGNGRYIILVLFLGEQAASSGRLWNCCDFLTDESVVFHLFCPRRVDWINDVFVINGQ